MWLYIWICSRVIILLEQLSIQYRFISQYANSLVELIWERFDHSYDQHLFQVLLHLPSK